MTHGYLKPVSPYFPALMNGRGLDMVKIVAALAMLADHTGYILYGGGLYTYLVGRMAFPLFCFAAAVAILRQKDAPQKLYRQAAVLFVFALLAEPVSQLTRSGYEVVNVLFTLSLGVVVAPVLLSSPAWLRGAAYLTALAAMSMPNLWEFGFAGMLLPTALAGALLRQRVDMAGALLLGMLTNFGGYATLDASRAQLMTLTVLCATLVPFALVHAMNAFYTTRTHQGRILSRYALHIFYPVHMLVLWGGGMLAYFMMRN